jgi:hypothetical protein
MRAFTWKEVIERGMTGPSALVVAPLFLFELAIPLFRALQHLGRSHRVVTATQQRDQSPDEDGERDQQCDQEFHALILSAARTKAVGGSSILVRVLYGRAMEHRGFS